ncbi:MAG TPA: sulfur reduction protein DsrE [Bacteroidales bacterium]|nr:sulfur reduction protein DsrE [Bacteroidales bacterium]
MKKRFLILTILIGLFVLNIHAQCGGTVTNTAKPTSIGIVISTNDVETIWNAIRFANFSKSEGDTVKIFLLGKGVELDNLVKTNKDLKEQTDTFLESGGTVLGCGTCLQSRKNNEPQVCRFSSMSDLYELIRKNKIVLTF